MADDREPSADELDALVRAVVARDAEAWAKLAAALAPRVAAIARSHDSLRSRKLASSDDDVAEIQLATLERLARDDHRNLRRYLEQRDDGRSERPQAFDSWLYGAAEFVIREHLRKRYGRAPRSAGGAATQPPAGVQPSKRDLQSHAARLDQEPGERSIVQAIGVVTRLTAAQIFTHIDESFSAEDAAALRLYYREDKSFEEIARALGLPDARAADKLIRKLNARLRYRFAEPSSG